jgi:adenylate kinase family enzyme
VARDLRRSAPPPLGRRIVVVGSTSSGKSTLAATLAERLDMPFVELDALFWLPNWVESDDDSFGVKMREATDGDAWVVAGSYRRVSERVTWPRAETMIWLDYRLPLLLWRGVVRAWRRWRSKELLWGTNYEDFWAHFYRRDSLLLFAIRTHRSNRRRWLTMMEDPQWADLDSVQHRSPAETERWLADVTARPRGG